MFELSLGALVSVLVAAVYLLAVLFVYEDAKRHDSDFPLVWALLTFIAPVFGLVAYLVANKILSLDL